MSVNPDAEKAAEAMDWLTFIASVVSSVAWPIAAFSIAFLFRAQISQLLKRLRKLSLGDKTIDFSDRLDAAEAGFEAAAPMTVLPPDSPLDQRASKLIELSPAAAILDAMRPIERAVAERAAPFFTGPDERKGVSFLRQCRILREEGLISASTYLLLERLRELRNAAAHDENVSAADAYRFFRMAENLENLLDGSDLRPDPPID